MACNDTQAITFSTLYYTAPCIGCLPTPCMPTSNICYSGPNLACSTIVNGDTLDDAFSKLDDRLCAALGNYASYQKNCLPAWYGSAINDEATFVDAITSYACAVTANLQTFTGTTFPAYQTSVQAQINTISGPVLTCASAGVISSDSLSTILTKYCTKFGTIDAALNPAAATWASCFAVPVPPTTIVGGFNEILSQLCQVRTLALAGGASALPTFNNIGTCLASPLTSTDTLVDTVTKIRTRLCLTPTYLSTNITWGCVGAPATTTNIEQALQKLVDKTNIMLPKQVAFGAGFTVVQTNGSDACEGVTVSVAAGTNNKVASTAIDGAPGTLDDKLLGTGIVIDSTTTPGKITLISNHKVSSSASDNTFGFLVDKLNGSTSNGITITPIYNSITKKVELKLSVDTSILCTLLTNCINVCASYLVTPASSSLLNYLNCDGEVVSLTIAGATTICARVGSVYAPAATIVNQGACASIVTNCPVLSTQSETISDAVSPINGFIYTKATLPSIATSNVTVNIYLVTTVQGYNTSVVVPAGTTQSNLALVTYTASTVGEAFVSQSVSFAAPMSDSNFIYYCGQP